MQFSRYCIEVVSKSLQDVRNKTTSVQDPGSQLENIPWWGKNILRGGGGGGRQKKQKKKKKNTQKSLTKSTKRETLPAIVFRKQIFDF